MASDLPLVLQVALVRNNDHREVVLVLDACVQRRESEQAGREKGEE